MLKEATQGYTATRLHSNQKFNRGALSTPGWAYRQRYRNAQKPNLKSSAARFLGTKYSLRGPHLSTQLTSLTAWTWRRPSGRRCPSLCMRLGHVIPESLEFCRVGRARRQRPGLTVPTGARRECCGLREPNRADAERAMLT